MLNKFLYYSKLIIQIPSGYKNTSLSFLLFIILCSLGSLSVRSGFISVNLLDSTISPIQSTVFLLLLCASLLFILYLEMNMLWRLFNGIRYLNSVISSSSVLNSRSVIIGYYSLLLIMLSLSFYVLSSLFSNEILNSLMYHCLILGLFTFIYTYFKEIHNWKGINY